MKSKFLLLISLLLVFSTACQTEVLSDEVEEEEVKEVEVTGKGMIEEPVLGPEDFPDYIVDSFVIDESIQYTPKDGYILSALIPSADGSKAIVSEWSYSMSKQDSNSSNWSYHISLLDIETGELEMLFEQEPEVGFRFIPTAFAGYCSGAYTPIAWNQNESGVILQARMPNLCGAGGFEPYGYHQLLIDSKEIVSLGGYDSLFSDDYYYVVESDYNESTLDSCTPFIEYPNLLTITNILSLESQVILNEKDTHYNLTSLSQDNVLSYIESEFILDEDKCYNGITNSVEKEFDMSEILNEDLKYVWYEDEYIQFQYPEGFDVIGLNTFDLSNMMSGMLGEETLENDGESYPWGELSIKGELNGFEVSLHGDKWLHFIDSSPQFVYDSNTSTLSRYDGQTYTAEILATDLDVEIHNIEGPDFYVIEFPYEIYEEGFFLSHKGINGVYVGRNYGVGYPNMLVYSTLQQSLEGHPSKILTFTCGDLLIMDSCIEILQTFYSTLGDRSVFEWEKYVPFTQWSDDLKEDIGVDPTAEELLTERVEQVLDEFQTSHEEGDAYHDKINWKLNTMYEFEIAFNETGALPKEKLEQLTVDLSNIIFEYDQNGTVNVWAHYVHNTFQYACTAEEGMLIECVETGIHGETEVKTF